MRTILLINDGSNFARAACPDRVDRQYCSFVENIAFAPPKNVSSYKRRNNNVRSKVVGRSVRRTAEGADGPVQEQGSERGELRQQDEVLERRRRDGVRPTAPLFVLGGRAENLVPVQRTFAVVPADRRRRHVQVNSGVWVGRYGFVFGSARIVGHTLCNNYEIKKCTSTIACATVLFNVS